MSKTRMGKRVASLLLSLVMMLSLLPTTVYATEDTGGGTGETNGAIVEATNTSDDSTVGGTTGNPELTGEGGGANVSEGETTTATGFADGSNSGSTLWNDKMQTADTNKNTTVTVAGETVFAPVATAAVAQIGETPYETLQAAIDAAEAGETVTLLADTTEDVTINKNITLDLGGKALTNTSSGKATISVKDGAVATVKNGFVKGGTEYYNIEVTKGSNADLTLMDVTATAGNNASSMIDNWGTLTINSGTYTGGLNVVKSEEDSKLIITGGTFTLDFAPDDGYTAVIHVYGDTTITGGAFIQNVTTGKWSHPQVVMTGVVEGHTAITRITGGTFTNNKSSESNIFHGVGKATSANFEVSGGTFNKSVSDSYMADGYIPVKNADGTYGVKEGKFVADVGSTGYETFDAAIAAANKSTNNKTVSLRENITVDHQLVIENTGRKTITLDLNGFTLTSTYAINTNITNGSYALVNKTPLIVKNGTFAAGQARAIGALDTLTLAGATVTQTLTCGHACVAFCKDSTTYKIEKNSKIDGAYAVCNFANNATITISDSTLIGTGNTLYHNGSNYGLKLTVTNTTIEGKGDGCGVYISGSTSAQSNEANQNKPGGYQQAIFTGCTISGTNGVEVKYTDLTLDGCTVEATVKTPSYTQDNNGPAGSGFAVVSTDNAMNKVTPKPEGTVIIKGDGKYTGLVGLGSLSSVKTDYADFEDETIKVSGGTFTTAVPESYCAEGYIPVKNADGAYGVKPGSYVAEVNGVKYETLQAAIDAAKPNTTVKMLADTKENVTIDKGLTLDLNGCTLNGGTEKGKPALTVTARVTVKDSSEGRTGTIMREDTAENSGVSSHYVIDVQGAGWLFFESGTVENNSGNTEGKGASLVRVGDDSVDKYPGLTIKGGTFTQDKFIVIKVDCGNLFLNGGTLSSANSYAIEDWHRATIKGGTVNGKVAAWTYSGGHNSDLTISGGTVNGDVKSVNYGSTKDKVAKVSITGGTVTGALDTCSYDPSTNELTGIDDATKATIAVTGGTFEKDPAKYVVEGSAVNKNTDGTYGVAKAYLASVGDTSYYTMDEAFKAQTASGKAIVMLRDYTTGSPFRSGSIDRTVDLNGHTWTCTGTDANSAAFEINYSNVTLTVKNGTVVSSQLVGLIPSAAGGTITYNNAGLVFENVVMTTTARSGIETNGNNTNDAVTLKNSTLNVLPNGFGIYFPSSGTLTIDNSTINAETMGVQVCSGSLNITGADTAITVTGDGIEKTGNDGAIEDGAAISIVNRAGYKGLGNVTVTGGTFNAKAGNDAIKAYNWADMTKNPFTADDKVSVSGGTFSSAVPEGLCAKGYVPTENGGGTYGVAVGKFTVKVTSCTVSSNIPVASVSGGGSNVTYAEGTTVTASAISGYNFVGWFVNKYTDTSEAVSRALSFKFHPTADCTLIAVYEPISGGVFALEVSASKFTVNGGATQRSYLLEKMPIGTQVTVVFEGSENFLYWVNESGKVVSTSQTYTFFMGSATTLKAVYAEKEENQAMVVFISHTQQVISSKGYTNTQKIQFPEPPIKMGATFVRWSMTEAGIRDAMATTETGIILVEPVYEFNADSYTVTVNYPNEETATYTATVGMITPVTAKRINEKIFKCWKNGDTVLGYTETLKIAPRGDLTLTAEYVDAGTTVNRLPVIALTEISASQQGERHAVSFTATRSVPDGYTVIEQGVLVSIDSRYGEAGALNAMKLDADGGKPYNTLILKATNTDTTGVTVLNGIVPTADRTVYGRAYMILRDSSGTMKYVYSDTILSGSYNGLNPKK